MQNLRNSLWGIQPALQYGFLTNLGKLAKPADWVGKSGGQKDVS